MINRRMALGLLASASTFAATGAALAQKDKDQKDKKDPKEKKPKKHLSGRQLLGGKIKQNGKHKLAKAGNVDVEVDVRGGKVASLTAQHPQKGNLSVRKVKSKQKLADATPKLILASGSNEGLQLAQYYDWYYGYWFEEDEYEWYYWFTADEVYVDETWVEYYY